MSATSQNQSSAMTQAWDTCKKTHDNLTAQIDREYARAKKCLDDILRDAGAAKSSSKAGWLEGLSHEVPGYQLILTDDPSRKPTPRPPAHGDQRDERRAAECQSLFQNIQSAVQASRRRADSAADFMKRQVETAYSQAARDKAQGNVANVTGAATWFKKQRCLWWSPNTASSAHRGYHGNKQATAQSTAANNATRGQNITARGFQTG